MYNKDQTDLVMNSLPSCLSEHHGNNFKVSGCFGADHSHAVFPKKVQLKLFGRGATSDDGTSRRRWNLIASNYHDKGENNFRY